ncbi:nuclear transport factor 2 family protein [Streptomyces sp. NBC_00555]|uniref:nuclear transport factor 2 family protein n=1 Tax=Streptomyces sp. NBC_00555 TaxID=2903662 RepID=UPI0022563373|nr:nuclear transport factor 2 family protein [Streptomyces sp. NBC_00555]MCX5011724.1 nuclear transport factor 2 family protein [Streptomyces sp. NBC_00555]
MTGEGSADPTALVVRFNDCINGRDIEGLARLMSDDHTFIDSEGGVVSGKQECLDAWRGFFESFPDYRNVFDSLTAREDVVTVVGHSVCSEPSLAGPALWTARIRNGEVAEWRVHEDTPQVREQLAVQDAE